MDTNLNTQKEGQEITNPEPAAPFSRLIVRVWECAGLGLCGSAFTDAMQLKVHLYGRRCDF